MSHRSVLKTAQYEPRPTRGSNGLSCQPPRDAQRHPCAARDRIFFFARRGSFAR